MKHWGGPENVGQIKGKQEVRGCMGGVGAVKPHYVVGLTVYLSVELNCAMQIWLKPVNVNHHKVQSK